MCGDRVGPLQVAKKEVVACLHHVPPVHTRRVSGTSLPFLTYLRAHRARGVETLAGMGKRLRLRLKRRLISSCLKRQLEK